MIPYVSETMYDWWQITYLQAVVNAAYGKTISGTHRVDALFRVAVTYEEISMHSVLI